MAVQSRSELGLEHLTESQLAYIFRMQLHPKNQSYFAETNPDVVDLSSNKKITTPMWLAGVDDVTLLIFFFIIWN